jgi:RHS repeat-associated protein
VADDRLTSDAYDANGNTVNSGGLTSVYDFENHLIQKGGATMVYDGNGNRVRKTVGGVTTKYLVDTLNPTGYAQVVYESIQGPGSNSETRNYTYGLDRISQTRNFSSGATQTSYYVHDGHGSTRALTDSTGNVTDTYDYDAFGNEIHSTGATPNEFLFAGEQYDPDLHLYYNRARYLNTTTGRFWTMDTHEAFGGDPRALHKYLYASADPVDRVDPTGNQDFISEVGELAITVSESAITVASEQGILEVVQAPVAVSALQTAVQWALTLLVLAPLVVQSGDNSPQRNGGVLQVQGKDMEDSPPNAAAVTAAGYKFSKNTLSWSWNLPAPLSGLTALQQLNGFIPLMNNTQIGRRTQAFIQAEQYIKNAMIAGGTGPVHKRFNANDPRVPDARVDIDVYAGRAFVPGP